MNYLQWNRAIGNFFFNEEHADTEVFLYITREDIIDIGKDYFDFSNNQECWKNFIKAMKEGYHDKVDDSDYLKTLLWLYEYYKNESHRNPNKYQYPLYLAYLSLSIIPVTESNDSYFTTDYYGPVNDFLNKFELPPLHNMNNNYNWNKVWEDLEHWSIIEKDMKLGYFEIHNFGNPQWSYVSKPLSQSIIPQKAFKNLPIIFEKEDIIPNSFLSENAIIDLVKNRCKELGIANRVLNEINKSGSEIKSLLVRIIREYHNKWDGTTFRKSNYENASNIVKTSTYSSLKLCLEINEVLGKIRSYFRIYSNAEFPKDLCFENRINCEYQINNWSKPILIKESNVVIEKYRKYKIEDFYNNWVSIWNPKPIIILSQGKRYGIAGWVESEIVEPNLSHLILLKKTSSDFYEEIKKDSTNSITEIPVNEKLPDFALFRCEYIPDWIKKYLKYQSINENYDLSFTNSLKLKNNKYFYIPNPKIEINLKNDDQLYLKYKADDKACILSKSSDDENVYSLPSNIRLNNDFDIIVKNETDISVNKHSIRIVEDRLENIEKSRIPKRNLLGIIDNEINHQTETFIGGNDLLNLKNSWLKRSEYTNILYSFRSEFDSTSHISFKITPAVHGNYQKTDDILLRYISVKREITLEDFFKSFEILMLRFYPRALETININIIKRITLQRYESMGFIDIDYLSNKITICPAQIIVIPNKDHFKGRKIIVTGARTLPKVNQIIKIAKEYRLKLFLHSNNDQSNEKYLLPKTIEIWIPGTDNNDYGENIIKKIAYELDVNYNNEYVLQPILLLFGANLNEYEQNLSEDENQIGLKWSKKIFDTTKLKFTHIDDGEIDNVFSLIQFELTPYDKRYKILKHGKLYSDNSSYDKGVDPKWARYLILNKYNINVILLDKKEDILYVPVTVPLPRLIAKALVLFSGNSPEITTISNNKYEAYHNVIPSLTINAFKQLGQEIKILES